MGLFTESEINKINAAARKSNLKLASKPTKTRKGSKQDIETMSSKVVEYFQDSKAELITTVEDLRKYIDGAIKCGYCAIDTETTGLDRINDTVVGFSLYYPGANECYIPNNHLIYIFNEPCKDQLTYQQCAPELQRLVDNKVKMIFANADYDLSMIYKDFGVDMCDICYYDVILAWRCLKENEKKNGLKDLYSKYVLKGKGDPMKFSDFFSVELFPYCKPSIAKLYAANDARITYELFKWQLPYLVRTSEKCRKNNLEAIADLVWNVEFPMIKVCALMHRNGIYFDSRVADKIRVRYHRKFDEELAELQSMVQDLIDDMDSKNMLKRPFKTGSDFIPTSPKHVQYLCYNLLRLPNVSGTTDKNILKEFGLPQTDKVLAVRSLSVLINSFVDKLYETAEGSDGRIHAQFKSVGADTGRMSSSNPNCIAGGTKITCVGGLKDIEDVEVGDLVYCIDEMSGKIRIRPIVSKWYKGIQDCVKLTWSSMSNRKQNYLILTKDHKVFTQTSGYVKVTELALGDTIYHLKRGRAKNSEDIILYSQPGALAGRSMVPEHQFVKSEYLNVDSNYDIHHKLDNLIVCDNGTHEIDEDELPTNFIQRKYSEVTKEEWYRILDIYCYTYWSIPMKYDTFVKYMKLHDIDYVQLKADKGYANIESYTDEEILNIFKRNDCSLYDTLCDTGFSWSVLKCKLFSLGVDPYNDSIVSLEHYGKCRVYDLEVEEHHNFVANELFVKNCQNIPSHANDIRHMFRATPQDEEDMDINNNIFTLNYSDRLETDKGFKPVSQLQQGDLVITDEGNREISNITVLEEKVTLELSV